MRIYISYLNCNKHANMTSWDFRMLVQHYMSIIEQLMFASEQKRDEIFLFGCAGRVSPFMTIYRSDHRKKV